MDLLRRTKHPKLLMNATSQTILGIICGCSSSPHENLVPRLGLRSHCIQRYVFRPLRFFLDLKMIDPCLAVTHAALSNWEYMEIIRQAADPKCSSHLEKSIVTIDTILNIPRLGHSLKALFGLKDLEHDEDFVSLLEVSLTYFLFQAKVDTYQQEPPRGVARPGMGPRFQQ